MKFVLMLGGLLLGIALGFLPGRFGSPKPLWWRLLAILAVVVTTVLAFLPPTGGSLTDAVIQSRVDSLKTVPVYITTTPSQAVADEQGTVLIPGTDARAAQVRVMLRAYATVADDLRAAGDGTPVIVLVRRAESDAIFQADDIVAVDPLITLPYIIGLETSARILFFHVPMSWIAVIAYLLAMIYGIRAIRRRSLEDDDMSSAAAALGTLYAVLATVTGAVWAKFTWGVFWNWDPRQTSIFLLLLVYAAYFLLRNAVEDPDRKARLSAVYAIVAFATVPFLVFVLPRLLPGLHPGSADDTNLGPLLSPKSDAINPTKQVVYGLSLFAFTLVFFWLMNLRVRATRAARRILESEYT